MNQEELPKEPTAQDLAAKHNRQQEEKAQAIKAIKATSRNTDCPCGCGNKAKKCVNGRRVLEFKKLMRGSALWEVITALLFIALIGVSCSMMLNATVENANHTVQSKP